MVVVITNILVKLRRSLVRLFLDRKSVLSLRAGLVCYVVPSRSRKCKIGSEVHLAVLFLLCHCHPLAQNIVRYMRIHAMLALGLDFDIS